ncbi:hypothetical protein [Pseudomonas nitroreducens]|uniref:hypothetical protein n=1 Tax=Pseudomonas nitroreducens TaxID=46680 RepID=UPI00351CFA09
MSEFHAHGASAKLCHQPGIIEFSPTEEGPQMRYGNSTMTTYYEGCEGAQTEPCVVVFRDSELVIEYLRDGSPSTYRGVLEGDQYQLRYWPQSVGFEAQASLCRPDPDLMDGEWSEVENGVRSNGTWEIELRE